MSEQKIQLQSELEKAQAAEDTAEETAETPDTNEDTSMQEENLSDTQTTEASETIDEYKTLLEEERGKRELAEKKIVKLKNRNKESDIDPEVVITAAREAVRQEIEASRAEDIGETVEDILSQLSTNPSKRELIQHHYDHTIQRSGTSKAAIFKDLSRAALLADEKKLSQENAELKRAIISRQTVSSPHFNGQPIREERNTLTSAEKTLLKGLKLTEADYMKFNKR